MLHCVLYFEKHNQNLNVLKSIIDKNFING